MTLNVLVCFPAALAGVYCFARGRGAGVHAALLSGVLFAFCGYLVSATNNPLYLEAAATMPWALWAADRFALGPSAGRLLAAALLAALVLLAGDTQAFAVWFVLAAAVVFTRPAP